MGRLRRTGCWRWVAAVSCVVVTGPLYGAPASTSATSARSAARIIRAAAATAGAKLGLASGVDLSASGTIVDAAGGFIDGSGEYSLTVTARPELGSVSGIQEVAVARQDPHGTTVLGAAVVTDCGTGCTGTQHTFVIAGSLLTEGANRLVAQALAGDGATYDSASWTVFVDKRPPTPSAAGSFADLAGRYIDGQKTFDLQLAAVDPGPPDGASGVASVALSTASGAEPIVELAQCTKQQCPITAQFAAHIDGSTLAEGSNVFRVRASDAVGHSATSGSWTVLVDRTPPLSPTDVFETDTSGHGRMLVQWDPSSDPELPDGTPGSGVTAYEYRIVRGGGANWRSVDGATATVEVGDGPHPAIEVRAVDAVGNVSTAVTAAPADDGVPAPPLDASEEAPPDPSGANLVQPWADPQLSETQSQDADAIVAADADVASLLSNTAHSIDWTSAWRADASPELLGAVVHITFRDPVTAAAHWRYIDFSRPTGNQPFSVDVETRNLSAISALTAYVDLQGRRVVGLEPETLADASTLRFMPKRSSTITAAAMPVDSSVGNGRATRNLTRLCLSSPDFCFYNYDFDAPNTEVLGSARWKHVDMPVTMIWWGGANEAKVEDILTHVGLGSLGSEMTARVLNDNPPIWIDRHNAGDKEHRCSWNTKIMHTRIYGDADDGHIDSLKYGFAVIGTTHFDWQECSFHGKSGYSEIAERNIASIVKQAAPNFLVKIDAIPLHNQEGWPQPYAVKNHVLQNDGRGTTIWMPGGPVSAFQSPCGFNGGTDNSLFNAPPNDNFDQAQILDAASASNGGGSTIGASVQDGEAAVDHIDGLADADSTVWYCWTAPDPLPPLCLPQIGIEPTGAVPTPSLVALWAGNQFVPGGLQLVADNYDAENGLTNTVPLDEITPGTTYAIEVADVPGTPVSHTFTLRLGLYNCFR